MQIVNGRIYVDMSKLVAVVAFYLLLPRAATIVSMLVAIALTANATRTGDWSTAFDFDAPSASIRRMWLAAAIIAFGWLAVDVAATWMF